MLILVLEVHPAVVATREEQHDHHNVEVDRKEPSHHDEPQSHHDEPLQNEPLEDQDQLQEELQNVQFSQNHVMVQNMNPTIV